MRKQSRKLTGPAKPELGKVGNERIGVHLTPNEAYELMQKLATDDTFRDRFEKNPGKELAKYHIDVPGGQSSTPIKLPAKSTLKRALNRVTIGGEFKTETVALAAAASYAWFHAVFSGYRFGLVASLTAKRPTTKRRSVKR